MPGCILWLVAAALLGVAARADVCVPGSFPVELISRVCEGGLDSGVEMGKCNPAMLDIDAACRLQPRINDGCAPPALSSEGGLDYQAVGKRMGHWPRTEPCWRHARLHPTSS